jgi:integral membrane sensor domain MASE1
MALLERSSRVVRPHLAGYDSAWLAARRVGRAAVVAVVYFAAARLGLSLASETRQVTAVLPPTGIALAALLLFGPRVWPGVYAGARR